MVAQILVYEREGVDVAFCVGFVGCNVESVRVAVGVLVGVGVPELIPIYSSMSMHHWECFKP